MNLNIDLHIHTVYSDGEKTPESLLEELKKNGLSHFSFTDHDNIVPFADIKRATLESGMNIIPGIEFSSLYNKREIHILGYKFDWHSTSLIEFIDERMQSRKERALLILNKLEKDGYLFEQRDIDSLFESRYIGRPHIADLLVKYGFVATIQDAFADEFIGNANSEIINTNLKPADEVISIIKQSGGLAFIAHPGLYGSNHQADSGMNKRDIRQLTDYGMDGIEVFHPGHSRSQIQRYIQFAKDNKLLISMGSDYHRGHYSHNPFSLSETKYIEEVLTWIEE